MVVGWTWVGRGSSGTEDVCQASACVRAERAPTEFSGLRMQMTGLE